MQVSFLSQPSVVTDKSNNLQAISSGKKTLAAKTDYYQAALSTSSTPTNTPLVTTSKPRGNPTSETVTISAEAKKAAVRLQSIANQYDVTNISTNERLSMAQELSDNSLLPNELMLYMAAPLSMNENPDEKSNYLQITKDALNFAEKMGGYSEHVKLQRQLLGILEHIDQLNG